MAKTVNFQKQMRAVQNLELPPSHGNYAVTKFAVEQWASDTVCVTRDYAAPDWKNGFAYHECFKVGPRGAVTKIYSSLY